MHHVASIALVLAPFMLVANAQVELDMDDVPTPCKTICRPIGTLSDRCDVDLRNDNDRDEDHLQNQCICTNKSFDVSKVAALCADCMHQNSKHRNRDDSHADRDDLEDIDRLLSECGFSSTIYNPAATSEVASITVIVTRPTNINQLTTTIDRNHPGSRAGGGSAVTSTSSGHSTSAATSSHSTSTGIVGGFNMTTQPASSGMQAPGTSAATSAATAASSTKTPNAAAGATAHAAYAAGGFAVAAFLLG